MILSITLPRERKQSAIFSTTPYAPCCKVSSPSMLSVNALLRSSFLCATSASPVSEVCFCSEFINHGDTGDAEVAQRKLLLSNALTLNIDGELTLQHGA